MFLQGKKGSEDIVLKAVIVIVIAIIMIFIVTAFGTKILGIFFPNEDKSTMKSFDTMYNVMNLEAGSSLGYDLTPVTLYMTKGYCVVLFDSPIVASKKNGGGAFAPTYTFYAPDDCDKKQCICLYDGEPSQTADKKGKNVVKCSTFTTTIYTDSKYNDMSPEVCSTSGEAYIPLLIIGNTVQDRHYTYILNNNDANKATVNNLKAVPLCPNDPVNTICNGQKSGTVISPTDDAGLKKIQEYCTATKDDQGNTHISTSLTCVYRDGKSCYADCSTGDVNSDCQNKYQKCEDLNQVQGIIPYISASANTNDYKYYYMCKNDANFCNRGCQPNLFQVYVTITSTNEEGAVEPQMLLASNPNGYTLLTPTIQQACNVKWSNKLAQGLVYLLSYNDSNQTCKDIIEKYFYPQKNIVFTCKSNEITCRDFISNRKKDCLIKDYAYIDDEYSWITYYDPKCDSDVKQLFDEVYLCGSKTAP